jgi:hypothetical protein
VASHQATIEKRSSRSSLSSNNTKLPPKPSLRRTRRLLTYIEEQGLIVCQIDGVGRRIVTLVELAWATAPGDPNAEEAGNNTMAAE